MFEFIKSGHNWFILFMLLSIEKFDTLFADSVQFPADINLSAIREVARNFVVEYDRCVHWQPGCNSDEIEKLKQDTHAQIANFLGETKARKFCDWGNQFPLGSDFGRSIEIISLIMWQFTKDKGDLEGFSAEGQEYIGSTFIAYRKRYSAVLEATDHAEQSPRTEWENQAIEIYNGGTEYSPDISMWTTPYDYVPLLFDFIEFPHWIEQAQKNLSQNDFDVLNQYVIQQIRQRKFNITHTDLYEIIRQK